MHRVLAALLCLIAADAVAQTPLPPAATTSWTLRDWNRVEMWRFFEPPAGGGNNDYAFFANRLFGGMQRTAPAYDFTAALQYVQFGGLPSDAVGPGPLGTGAVYFAHAASSDSNQIYLRYANVRLKRLIPSTVIQIGRMPYASGGEAASGNPKIESMKLQRVAARLIGEFEWSIYQRAYDGVRVDTTRARWTGTAFAFHPTQGGFEDAAGLMMPDVTVAGGSATITSATSSPSVQFQAFAYRYRDTSNTTARQHLRLRNAALVRRAASRHDWRGVCRLCDRAALVRQWISRGRTSRQRNNAGIRRAHAHVRIPRERIAVLIVVVFQECPAGSHDGPAFHSPASM